MSFDVEMFRHAEFSHRKAQISVPNLTPFFPDGGPPIWTVRGLSGEEIARSNESSARNAGIAAALYNSISGKTNIIEAIELLIGYRPDVPEDLAKRIEHMSFGSVSPVLDRPLVVKLFAVYPAEAYILSQKIIELTGLGAELGKALPSTPAPT